MAKATIEHNDIRAFMLDDAIYEDESDFTTATAFASASSAAAAASPSYIGAALAKLFNDSKHTYNKSLAEEELNGILDFSSQDLDNNKAEELSSFLEQSTTVTTLNLTFTGLTDDHCVILSQSLSKNIFMSTLILDYNFLSNTGVQAILKALQHNRNLSSLSMNKCGITENSVGILLNFLRHNTTVCTLWYEPDVPSYSEDTGVSLFTSGGDMVIPRSPEQILLDKQKAEIQQILKQNQENKLKRDQQAIRWMEVAARLSFQRANKDSQIKHSIQPLLPFILSFIRKEQNKSVMIGEKIMDTKFYIQHLNVSSATAVVGYPQPVIAAESTPPSTTVAGGSCNDVTDGSGTAAAAARTPRLLTYSGSSLASAISANTSGKDNSVKRKFNSKIGYL